MMMMMMTTVPLWGSLDIIIYIYSYRFVGASSSTNQQKLKTSKWNAHQKGNCEQTKPVNFMYVYVCVCAMCRIYGPKKTINQKMSNEKC